jgi:uncharacterized protein
MERINVVQAPEQPVASPCIGYCCLDPMDICMGCFRSLDEIKQWLLVDDVVRRQIIENTKQRQQQAQDVLLL